MDGATSQNPGSENIASSAPQKIVLCMEGDSDERPPSSASTTNGPSALSLHIPGIEVRRRESLGGGGNKRAGKIVFLAIRTRSERPFTLAGPPVITPHYSPRKLSLFFTLTPCSAKHHSRFHRRPLSLRVTCVRSLQIRRCYDDKHLLRKQTN